MATNKRVERQLADMCWRNTRQKKRCTLPAAKTGAAHKTRRAARLRFVVRNVEFMGKMCASATFHQLFYNLVYSNEACRLCYKAEPGAGSRYTGVEPH